MRVLITLVVAFLLAMSLGNVGAQSVSMARGMNFNFTEFDRNNERQCGPNDKRTTFGTKARLVNYQDANVQQESRENLRMLVKQGVTWVRSQVWFTPTGRQPIAFDVGRDRAIAARNIQAFSRDLVEAGVRNWVIAFGPQGAASPSCRIKRYGDCHDAASTPAAVEFIIGVRRALESVPHPQLWVDLYNEGCPRALGEPDLNAVKVAYAKQVIVQYRKEFPNDRVTISCVGDNAQNLGRRLVDMSALFEATGSGPAFFDAHIYDGPNRDISASARVLAETAARMKKPAVVGETNIARPDVEAKLISGFKAANNSPMAMIYWPIRDNVAHCRVDQPETLH